MRRSLRPTSIWRIETWGNLPDPFLHPLSELVLPLIDLQYYSVGLGPATGATLSALQNDKG